MKIPGKSGNSIIRAVFVGLSLLLQVAWLLLMIQKLNRYSAYIALITGVIASLAVLRLYSRRTNSAYKMLWIMLIMALPVMGLSLYLLTQVSLSPRSAGKRVRRIQTENEKHLVQKPGVLEELEQRDLSAANQCHYLLRQSKAPVYRNTQTVYFSQAELAFDRMKRTWSRRRTSYLWSISLLRTGSPFPSWWRFCPGRHPKGWMCG